MAALSLLMGAVMAGVANGAIYPDDHWTYSTELTTENVDEFVKTGVDAGKTVFGAGSGGWPTVRHFNKATGYGGEAYKQKTSGAMCDELGPKTEYMHIHVEEAGGTSLCDVSNTEKGCSDQQKTFIEKWVGKPKDDLQKQVDRLHGMVDKDGASMKPEALTWAKQRLAIVKKLHSKEEL